MSPENCYQIEKKRHMTADITYKNKKLISNVSELIHDCRSWTENENKAKFESKMFELPSGKAE